MKVLVVNCSYECRGRGSHARQKTIAGSLSGYNLGALKLSDWLRFEGHEVTYWDGDPGVFSYGYDLVCLSVVFSWHAPLARDIALRVRDYSEIWCGGPGMFAPGIGTWWKKQTGMERVRGLDWRFERQRGEYLATFASRGCPVNCRFCLVPKMEGTEFTMDDGFQPAPILCDNNLSALPEHFQEHIIGRYQQEGVPLLDANSGFEPRTFTGETYHRWKSILRGPWRFALDEFKELDDVRRMMDILRAERRGRKRVYVLIGNEPIEACYERAEKVIEWGGEPYCQPEMPLNSLSRDNLRVVYDWTYQQLRDFARYYNRPALWKSVTLPEYRPRKKEHPPFAHMASPRVIKLPGPRSSKSSGPASPTGATDAGTLPMFPMMFPADL